MAHTPGRDRKKEVFWRRIIAGQPRSGLSVRAWCREHALHESSFYWWRRRLARSASVRGDRRDKVSSATTLVPVRISAEPDADAGLAGRLEIIFPDARRVRVVGPVDRRALADVLAVLVDQGWGTQDALPEGMNGVRSRGVRSC